MAETNGVPNGYWSKVSPREVILICACLLPGIGGYFVTQYRVGAIEANYVTHDQLAIEVTKATGLSGIQAEQLKELTEVVRSNNEAVVELTQEVRNMRGEWSHYSAHPKGHNQP